MKQNIQTLQPTKHEPLNRTWFMARGCKQVPPDLTGGKILWAHPDGYFLNQYGQKLNHNYSPSKQKSRPNMHSAYPILPNFGSKNCHILICVTFHGPRPIINGVRYECDHINGDKLDYSAANLEWVAPAENRKRAKILRAMRAAGNDPRQLSPERLKNIFSRFSFMDGADQMHFECTHHMEL